MPAALEYILDQQSVALRPLEEAYAAEYNDRQARFAKHWNYYDGKMPEPLRVEQDGYNDNVLLAKTDQVADKLVSFLLGDGLAFDVAGDGERQAIDDSLAQLWTANREKRLQHNIALSGVLSGHCWVRVEQREGQWPRIVNLDPQHCTVFWDLEDVDRVLWYRLQYQLGEAGKRIDYVRASAMPGAENAPDDVWYEIVYRRGKGGRWERRDQGQRLDYCPIVEWQNSSRPFAFYGADDVRRVVALNDALNFTASNISRILKHYSGPRTIGIGMDAADVVASGASTFWTVNRPTSEANIYNLEMQSDLASAREFMAIVLREIWQSARMVDPQTVKDSVGQLTNFALRVLYQDAITKTNDKRELYEEGLVAISKLGLQLAGIAPPETINVTWPDVLPEDATQVAQALLPELSAGVIDKQTYRELRGYANEVIEERLQEEKAGEEDLGSRLLTAFAKGA